jgi:hypothetical protein
MEIRITGEEMRADYAGSASSSSSSGPARRSSVTPRAHTRPESPCSYLRLPERAQRKPMVLVISKVVRNCSVLRPDARTYCAELYQEPPFITPLMAIGSEEPPTPICDGPIGLDTRSAVYVRFPSWHHSHTLPSISYSPNAFGNF